MLIERSRNVSRKGELKGGLKKALLQITTRAFPRDRALAMLQAKPMLGQFKRKISKRNKNNEYPKSNTELRTDSFIIVYSVFDILDSKNFHLFEIIPLFFQKVELKEGLKNHIRILRSHIQELPNLIWWKSII